LFFAFRLPWDPKPYARGTASYGAPYPEVPFKAGWAPPRVGFAYTLDSETVVRAGYGIYRGRSLGFRKVRMAFRGDQDAQP
jgi:hypothetical protein